MYRKVDTLKGRPATAPSHMQLEYQDTIPGSGTVHTQQRTGAVPVADALTCDDQAICIYFILDYYS